MLIYAKEVDIRNRKEDTQFRAIGAEIKLKRKALSKTLTALSGAKASVSYISKIENNKIVPSIDSLIELCEKVNINETEFNKIIDVDNKLQDAIKAFFYGNTDVIKKIKEDTADYTFYQARLLELIANCYFNEIAQAKQNIASIQQIIKTLVDEEVLLVLFCECHLALIEEQYGRIIDLAFIATKFGARNDILRILIDEAAFYAYIEVYAAPQEHLFTILQKEFSLRRVYFRLHRMEQKYLLMAIKIGFNSVIEYYKSLNLQEWNDIFCICDLYMKNLDVANDVLKKKDSHYHGRILAAYLMNDERSIRELIGSVTQGTYVGGNDLLYYNYLAVKLSKNDKEIKEYIVDWALPKAMESKSLYYSTYYCQELLSVNSRNALYKESSNAAVNLIKMMDFSFL